MKISNGLLQRFLKLKKQAAKLENEIEAIRAVLLDNDGYESNGLEVEVSLVAKQFAVGPAELIAKLGEKRAFELEVVINRRIKYVKVINKNANLDTAA